MKYYAVANGRKTGIFLNWDECNKSVKGYKNAKYKKFDTKIEAQDFINRYNNSAITNKTNIQQNNITNFFKLNTSDNVIDNDVDDNDIINVYTDGSCINNGSDNAISGIGVYFGENDPRNISSKISGKQTNNTAELKAILKACEILGNEIKDNKQIIIHSDSKYSIHAFTKYGDKLEKQGWIQKNNKPIPNIELVKQGYHIFKNNKNIKLCHVKAHTDETDEHSIGNDNADKLANKAIGINSCPYNKIYLNVPYTHKDNVKKLGGKWDKNKKKWYILNNNIHKDKLICEYV